MHPTVQRVVDAAAVHGLRIEPHEYPDGTHTAEDAARAIGVSVGQIVKSLAFAVDGEVVLALVSGPNRLDERALALAANGGRVERADAKRVREATGYAIGGVPPFGHAQPLATFIDEDLLGYDTLWAAAGTPRHNFSVTPADLVRITGGTVAPLRSGRP